MDTQQRLVDEELADPARPEAPIDTTNTASRLSPRRLTVQGVVATSLIVLGGVAAGPHPPGTDIAAFGWLYAPLRGGPGTVFSYLAVYAGLGLLVATWLQIGRAIRRGAELPVATLLRIGAIWVVPLIIGPPMFSRDVFSYAAQGRMVVQGWNPYRFGPIGVLWTDRYLLAVPKLWASARAPYGPLFLGLDAGIVRLAGHNLVLAILGLRVIEVGGLVLAARFLPRLAARLGIAPVLAVWLGLLNPLILLHLVGGAHNDALMLGLLVAGVALAVEGRPVVGLVLCTLAAAIKIPAAAGAVYVAIDWARQPRLPKLVLSRLFKAAAVVVGTFVVLSQVVGLGWGWVFAIGNPEKVWSALSPVIALSLGLSWLTHLLGLPLHTGAAVHVARELGMIAALGASAVVAVRSRRLGMVWSLALTFTLIVVLGPVIQPWYLTWGLILLAAAGGGWLRPTLVWGSVAVAFAVLPSGSELANPLMLIVVGATGAVLYATRRGRPLRPALEWLRI